MSKELFNAIHDQLAETYQDEHGCDWNTAYERTADAAHVALNDRLADMADAMRDRAKYGE